MLKSKSYMLNNFKILNIKFVLSLALILTYLNEDQSFL